MFTATTTLDQFYLKKQQMSKRKAATQKGRAPKRQRVTAPTKSTLKPLIPDTKYFDSDLNVSGIVNIAGAGWQNAEQDPATLNTLFAPVQGDDIINRQGKRVFVKSIKVRGFVTIAAQTVQATSDSSAITRIILLQDQRTNNVQENAEDVMASGSATTNNVACYQNTSFFGKFKILKDKYFWTGNANIAGVTASIEQQGLQYPFKWNIKFTKPVEMNFSSNNGNIGDIVDNSFHIIAATNNGTLAQSISYKCRTSFYG